MNFDRELVVLHMIPHMFGKFVVHAWRLCGGLNVKHPILVHKGSNSSWHGKRCYSEFGPQ